MRRGTVSIRRPDHLNLPMTRTDAFPVVITAQPIIHVFHVR